MILLSCHLEPPLENYGSYVPSLAKSLGWPGFGRSGDSDGNFGERSWWQKLRFLPPFATFLIPFDSVCPLFLGFKSAA